MCPRQKGLLALSVLSLCAALVSASVDNPVNDVDELYKSVKMGGLSLTGASGLKGSPFGDYHHQEYQRGCLREVAACRRNSLTEW